MEGHPNDISISDIDVLINGRVCLPSNNRQVMIDSEDDGIIGIPVTGPSICTKRTLWIGGAPKGEPQRGSIGCSVAMEDVEGIP